MDRQDLHASEKGHPAKSLVNPKATAANHLHTVKPGVGETARIRRCQAWGDSRKQKLTSLEITVFS